MLNRTSSFPDSADATRRLEAWVYKDALTGPSRDDVERRSSKEAAMKSSIRALARAAGATAIACAVGCGHPATPPASPARLTTPDVPATTTTTSGQAPQTSTSGVNVSDALKRACNLHFDNLPSTPKFDFDSDRLRPDDQAVLEQVAKCLTTGPLKGRQVQLVGRADPRGELEYNFTLGSHRADSVERYLQSLGVGGAQLNVTSRGKLDAMGTDEATWQRDRRVDIDLR